MKVRWSDRAIAALMEIRAHIAEDNPTAARVLSDRIRAHTRTTLKSHPFSGRPGRVDGTREAVVPPSYIIVYRVSGDMIDILTVRHAAQRWPAAF